MRSDVDVEDFRARLIEARGRSCEACGGTDPKCRCRRRIERDVAAYEACVPQDFWRAKAKDVTHNKTVFEGQVLRYTAGLDKAVLHGYGLAFLGDNGVGKTMFISYVLMQAIKAGRSAYYTTMPQLDHDIKRGFNDRTLQERLDWYLTSDFLAIDEMGKERFKTDSTFAMTQIERILKKRYDDSQPVLLATNMDIEGMVKAYGSTIGSILRGKYELVNMEPGDFREASSKKMRKDMGYDG